MFGQRACGVCGEIGDSPCGRCIRGLEGAGEVLCPDGLVSCSSTLLFQGIGREVVASIKYQNQRQSLGWLASLVAHQVEATEVIAATSGTRLWVSWVPTAPSRRRQRGFDHSERLARRVGRRLHLPVRRLLRSTEAASTNGGQTNKSATERRQRPGFATVRSVRGSVLLLDDVLTTGATLSAAAAALRAAGATAVHGATIAYTPPPRRAASG